MAAENIADRVERLLAEAVRSGRAPSVSALLKTHGLSTGLVGELRSRLRKNADATMTGTTAERLAGVLGVSIQTILSGQTSGSDLVDKYRERAAAIDAARSLKLPEAAIQLVLREDPGGTPNEMYWFRRIESESERIEGGGSGRPDRPVPDAEGSSPAADSGSHKI